MNINLDPTIVSIGSLDVGWHGVLMFIGTCVGVGVTVWLARRVGIKDDITFSAALWAVIFGFIGARVTNVIDNWAEYYSHNPGKILAVQEGGLGWYGCLIGGTLAVAVYSRIAKFSLGKFADAAAPGIFAGLSIGRIGCTLNGDAVGAVTTLPWGLVYTHELSMGYTPLLEATHPAPVYEILWNVVMLVILWRLWKRLAPDGSLFLVSLALYGVGRFIISWYRAEALVWGGPLHQSHVISIGIFVFAVVMLIVRKTRLVKPEPEPPPQPAEPAPQP